MDDEFDCCLLLFDFIFLSMSWLKTNEVEQVPQVLLENHLRHQIGLESLDESGRCHKIEKNDNRIELLGQC